MVLVQAVNVRMKFGNSLNEVFTEAMNYAVARGPHPEWTTISEAIRTATQNIVLGTKDTQDALKEAADVINPILEKNPLPKAE